MLGLLIVMTGCTKEPGKVACEIRHGNVTSKSNLSADGAWEAVGEGADARRVDIRDGHVFANGKDCGEIAAGDMVLLDDDNQLWVNGQKRKPQ